MKRSILLCSAILALVFSVHGQKSLVGTKILQPPAEYINGPYRVLGANAPIIKDANYPWIVYSDRDDNPTFATGAANAAKKSNIKFGQAFFVIEQNDDFVHIVEYDKLKYDAKTRKITGELQDFGWVPKSKMLLWEMAVIDEKTRFTRKCLAVNSLQTLENYGKYAKGKELRMFNAPAYGNENKSQVKMYNFLWVYKEEGGFVLVGKKKKSSASGILKAGDLLGWVSKDIVQMWSQRLALEPNSDGTAAYERKQKNTPIKVFTTEKGAQAYQQKGGGNKEGVEIPFTDYFDQAYPSEWKRFPVMSADGAALLRTGVVTAVFDSTGSRELLSVKEQYEVTKEYEATRKDVSKVNVIFVVDGSASMLAYKEPINDAIRNATAKIRDNTDKEVTFEYGAVLYRSKGEAACGNKVIETQSLTFDETKVIRFLSEETVWQDCASSKDGKSLFKAMDEALNMMNRTNQKRETNVVVVIGGEGNDPTETAIKDEDLIRKIGMLRSSLMVFQVSSTGEPLYNKFIKEMSRIIRESEKQIQLEYKDMFTKTGVSEIEWMDQDETTLKVVYPGTAPVPGFFLWAGPGRKVDAALLGNEVEKIILETIDNNNSVFSVTDTKITGIGQRQVMNEAARNFLSQMNVNVELLEATSESNIQLFVEGYTPKRVEGLNSDLYQYVILVDDLEFNDMLLTINKFIYMGNSLEEQRRGLEETYKSVVASHFGPTESKNIIKNSSLEEIHKLLFGLPGNSSFLNSMKVADITKMDPGEMRRYVDTMTDKYSLLREWQGSEKNCFYSGGQRFYWLPQRLMP
jgi:hypothetical protein